MTAIHRFGGFANWTADTTAALAYISRRKLDGIFLDMRVEGALKLVASIRRGSSNRYSTIFACAPGDEDAARLLNLGVNFIVQKNLDAEKVALVLEGAVQMMLLERQRYLRYSLTIPVTLKSTGGEQNAVTANISRGGMAVRGKQSLEPGRAINFVLDLPGGQAIQGQGEVAWAKTDGNMGIRFYLLRNDIKQTLWNWIDEYGTQHPA
ncbi:MAG TPA: PilZ domain-containing protein [Candidatus Angelobacter sp.]|nr:PilZ domain-containing protein [Candidatus Angelobacter sp.]